MGIGLKIPQRFSAILVYGRAPLAFTGMICAMGVMWTHSPSLYVAGSFCLFVSMCFDLVDGWFAARFGENFKLADLADRMLDKMVYSILFPLLTGGAMWRLLEVSEEYTRTELLHALLILILCISVLFRDNFAHFMRGFAIRKGELLEKNEYTRLRTIAAAPVSALLYAHLFYVPSPDPGIFYTWISWMGRLPLRNLFFIEILFLIITFGSIAGYCRRFGTVCLDELCLGDVRLRRRILSVFPNALTLMNAMMGLLAVFFAYQGKVQEAYLFLVGGAFFDKVDGALARRLGLTEPLGNDHQRFNVTLGALLDDISDAVSFCLAPAWIFYIVLSNTPNSTVQNLPIGFAASFYCLLGLTRLIYFTLDHRPIPGFFKGMPTPAAALLVAAPLIMLERAAEVSSAASFWGIFCFVLMILAAMTMNLFPIRYLHVGRFMDRRPWFTRINVFIFLFSLFTPFFGYVALIYGILYLLSPLATGHLNPRDITAAANLKTDSGS